MTQKVLGDWRNADLDPAFVATLAFLEKLNGEPSSIGPEDAAVLKSQGLSQADIADAIYICAAFNVIGRVADALDFQLPPRQELDKVSKMLLGIGYRV